MSSSTDVGVRVRLADRALGTANATDTQTNEARKDKAPTGSRMDQK